MIIRCPYCEHLYVFIAVFKSRNNLYFLFRKGFFHLLVYAQDPRLMKNLVIYKLTILYIYLIELFQGVDFRIHFEYRNKYARFFTVFSSIY